MHQTHPPSSPTLRAVILFGILAVTLSGCSDDETALTVTDAWILERPFGQISSGGFSLHNRGDDSVILQQIEAADFGHIRVPGISEPEAPSGILSIPIPKHSVIRLGAEIHSLVLDQPQRRLRDGDTSLLTLRFSDGRIQLVNATVTKTPPAP